MTGLPVPQGESKLYARNMRLFLVTYLRAQKLPQKVTTKKRQLEAIWLKYNFCRY
jgi:hypothetical protein